VKTSKSQRARFKKIEARQHSRQGRKKSVICAGGEVWGLAFLCHKCDKPRLPAALSPAQRWPHSRSVDSFLIEFDSKTFLMLAIEEDTRLPTSNPQSLKKDR